MSDDHARVVAREYCPSCGSKDNLARYADGHAYCFGAGCGRREPAEGGHRQGNSMYDDDYDDPDATTVEDEDAGPRLLGGQCEELPKRRLTKETCQKFDYRLAQFKGQWVQVANYRNKSGKTIAQKLRFADKDAGMPWLGLKDEAVLFGQHLWGRGKKLVITEGEIDAMTVSQMQGHKWPVVSIKNGTGATNAPKALTAQLDWLAGFDEIVLMFDMDEAGRTAVEQCAHALFPMKVLVAQLPEKDPNACLLAGKGEAIVDAIWKAKPYSPDNVFFGSRMKERIKNRPKVVSHPFPDWLPLLNKAALGFRMAELTTWTSGSGMGKTTMLKMLQHYIFETTPWNQAIIHLEEPLEDTGEDLVAIRLGKRLRLPHVRETVTEEEIDRALDDLLDAVDEDGNPRLVFHDAWGSNGDDEALFNRIRYYARHHRAKVIWLDHLSILVSDMGEDGDERRRIDSLMHNLAKIAVEENIHIALISHLKKAAGQSYEEGGVPNLDSLRGSGSIKQLSMNVFAMSRDQQHEHEIARRTAQVHVLKCRYTGATGPGDFILYDPETGLFEPGEDPEMLANAPPPIPGEDGDRVF